MSPLDIILLCLVLVISVATAFPIPVLLPWLGMTAPSDGHHRIMVYADNVTQSNGSLPNNRIVRLNPPVERRQSFVGTILSETMQGFGSATSGLAAEHLSDEVTGNDKDHEEKEKDD